VLSSCNMPGGHPVLPFESSFDTIGDEEGGL
jgi:hypothetical protein